MEENKGVTSGDMKAMKAPDVSHCGKLFCFGRGIDVASLATHIVTPFLGPYSKPPG